MVSHIPLTGFEVNIGTLAYDLTVFPDRDKIDALYEAHTGLNNCFLHVVPLDVGEDARNTKADTIVWVGIFLEEILLGSLLCGHI